ncbi:uncharacterized protein V1510DRAFT_416573 [Dipodascopsis tothii]|uniref:uncharacterized protein n=1 Tax=Dipodascopsis tothii TaxID=44089 RepID=UPI0034CE1839
MVLGVACGQRRRQRTYRSRRSCAACRRRPRAPCSAPRPHRGPPARPRRGAQSRRRPKMPQTLCGIEGARRIFAVAAAGRAAQTAAVTSPHRLHIKPNHHGAASLESARASQACQTIAQVYIAVGSPDRQLCPGRSSRKVACGVTRDTLALAARRTHATRRHGRPAKRASGRMVAAAGTDDGPTGQPRPDGDGRGERRDV